MAGDGQSDLRGAQLTLSSFYPDDSSAVADKPDDLTILDDVDAERIGGASVSPGDRVVAGDSASTLEQTAPHRIAGRSRVVQQWEPLAHLTRAQQLPVDPIELQRVHPPCQQLKMMRAVADREHAALTEHDIESKLPGQSLVQAQSEIIEVCALGIEVVRAHHRGIAPGIAATKPAALDHRHLADAVLLGQVVSRREPVPTATDDNHVIARLRCGAAPQLWPILME